MISLKDISITMGLGEMTVEARMVQQDVIYEFGVFFCLKSQISQILITRIKTVEYELKPSNNVPKRGSYTSKSISYGHTLYSYGLLHEN